MRLALGNFFFFLIFLIFFTNLCFVVFLGSNVRTTSWVGKRVTKKGPKATPYTSFWALGTSFLSSYFTY